MHALGIHDREVRLTAGLAWLLDPDGWHGLGTRVLHSLLVELGLPAPVVHPVIVTTEEPRTAWRRRADLVVRMPGMTLLFEAKVHSGESDEQCDDLSKAWGPEVLTLVFLTRDGRPPLTAVQSAGQWQSLTWDQVGAAIRAAIAQVPNCAAGARELLATIETFQGASPAMPGDERVAFYLQHRQEIEEWAALRNQAAAELEDALVRAVEVMCGSPDAPTTAESAALEYPWYGIKLELPAITPAEALVALGWNHKALFSPSGAIWPYIGINIVQAGRQLADKRLVDKARELLRDVAQARHWSESTRNWVWWEYLPVEVGDTDLDAYAVRQVDGLVAAHAAVQWALR